MIQRGGEVVIRMMSMTFIAAWNRGAMRMQASVTAVANRRGMMTAMAFMKYT